MKKIIIAIIVVGALIGAGVALSSSNVSIISVTTPTEFQTLKNAGYVDSKGYFTKEGQQAIDYTFFKNHKDEILGLAQ